MWEKQPLAAKVLLKYIAARESLSSFAARRSVFEAAEARRSEHPTHCKAGHAAVSARERMNFGDHEHRLHRTRNRIGQALNALEALTQSANDKVGRDENAPSLIRLLRLRWRQTQGALPSEHN